MNAIDLSTLNLATGSHRTREDGVCAMEAVAWLAGEPHSDRPACACPIIGMFVTQINDRMTAEVRNSVLKPLLSQLVGSKATKEVETRRAFVAADYAVRVFAPQALCVAGKMELANKLQGMPKIVDKETVTYAADAAAAAAAAHAAAWDAARAAYAAASASAVYAAYAAVYAAWAAARAAYVSAAAAAAAITECIFEMLAIK